MPPRLGQRTGQRHTVGMIAEKRESHADPFTRHPTRDRLGVLVARVSCLLSLYIRRLLRARGRSEGLTPKTRGSLIIGFLKMVTSRRSSGHSVAVKFSIETSSSPSTFRLPRLPRKRSHSAGDGRCSRGGIAPSAARPK